MVHRDVAVAAAAVVVVVAVVVEAVAGVRLASLEWDPGACWPEREGAVDHRRS